MKVLGIVVAAAVIVVLAANVPAGSAVLDDDPAQVGQWSGLIPWPAVAVHSILLRDGRVLWFRGDEEPLSETYVWNPLTDEIVGQAFEGDIFCAGHSFLADGRILVTGGSDHGEGGPPTSFLFDPATTSWTRGPDMRHGRFYPTNVALGDGRTVVVGGADENQMPNPQIEVFVPGANGEPDRWDLLEGSLTMETYPRLHLLPSGKIVRVGAEAETLTLDPDTGYWQYVTTSPHGMRDECSSVMLPPSQTRIMVMGGENIDGGTDPTPTTQIIDMADDVPSWTDAAPMHYARWDANAVILPDGTVLVAGGADDREQQNPVLAAEIYDPVADAWTVVAPMTVPRRYHSSAALLPDGRVLWAGANHYPSAEIYSPPYLFQGPRPTIRTTPEVIQYGGRFRIKSPAARSIASVVLIRPGATTHAINMEQRYVPLAFTRRGARQLVVTAPGERNVAPPGYYMLFVVNGNGIPSVARMVRIE